MQFSLPFIDIIIFAVIAIFLVYRLKNIWGQNLRGNDQNNKIDIEKKDYSNVVNLENKKLDINVEQSNQEAIYKVDPTFDEKEFLKGAEIFLEWLLILKANLKNVSDYIDNKLVKNFQLVIDERLEEDETLKIDI